MADSGTAGNTGCFTAWTGKPEKEREEPMEDRLIRQLALDYCCTPAQVRDGKNHFT